MNNEINRKYSDIKKKCYCIKKIFYQKKYINLKVKCGLLTYLLLLLMKRYELMRAFLVAQLEQNLPAMQKALV